MNFPGAYRTETTPMKSIDARSDEVNEIQRLDALLPPDLRSRIAVVRSVQVNPPLIATEKVNKNRFSIKVDLVQWHPLSANQRDLLFLHEVARIQNRTTAQFQWETIALGAGLATSLIELNSQNLLSLSVALVVTGLAGYQLYQRNQGEQNLREATAADQTAIELAVQRGYSFSKACKSLHNALTVLAKQTPKKSRWKKYQVRLRVLEILAEQDKKASEQLPLNLDILGSREKIQNLASDSLSYSTRYPSKLE